MCIFKYFIQSLALRQLSLERILISRDACASDRDTNKNKAEAGPKPLLRTFGPSNYFSVIVENLKKNMIKSRARKAIRLRH